MDLSITNVVQISVIQPPAGLGSYRINNLALFTKEVPNVSPPQGYYAYRRPFDVGIDWGTSSEAYQQAVNVFNQAPNILTGDGELLIFPMQSGDLLATAIPAGLARQYFGGAMWAGYTPNDAEVTAAVTVAQSSRTMLFVSSYLISSAQSGGLFTIIQQAGEIYGRCFCYTRGGTPLAARLAMAAYAGRLMSVDFTGSNTTITMQMKDLVGILPDDGINQTTLDLFETVGVDCYASIAGLPKVFSFGANEYADQVYNLTAFVNALQVAGFNAIATSGTKIPQTEPGVAVLKNAYLAVLQQFVTNGYLAPGAWNSPDRFGDPEDMLRNILQLGFYIFSQPVNLQPQTDRVARRAPLIQIAGKEAGAIHSTSVIVEVNA